MAKMTKIKKAKTKPRAETKRATLLGQIYTSLENMTDLFSSSAAEHYSVVDLDVLTGELEDTEKLAVKMLHEQLNKLSAKPGQRKQVAARRR